MCFGGAGQALYTRWALRQPLKDRAWLSEDERAGDTFSWADVVSF